MKTEKEMRDADVPSFKNKADLMKYINDLVNRPHDYGTCCYAMSMAAVAAFQYVARKIGVTGFQASCADLDVIRRTRGIKGPFILIQGNDMLYPQYDIAKKLQDATDSWREWARDEAKKKLKENDAAHPEVIKHWKKLAAYEKNPTH